MKNDASCRVTPALGGSYRSDSEKEFGHSDKCGNLTNPEKKHPFDDLCLDVCPILLSHEALGEVLLLLPEGEFQTFGDGTSLRRFDLGRLQDRENFCRAHYRILARVGQTVKRGGGKVGGSEGGKVVNKKCKMQNEKWEERVGRKRE